MSKPVRVGIIGCGGIVGQYLDMARKLPALEVVACSDIEMDRARAKAAEYQVPRAYTSDQLLNDDSIEIVLNLTVPKAHLPVSLAAIEAGKHVYVEKPLGVDREEGSRLLEAARAKSLRIGCAPDTFMGAGLQTARKLLDEGAIGRPVAFTGFMLCPGHEAWHANPEFHYEIGGGPMFDMGPYYVTALLNLLGPVRRYSGAACIAIPQRTIGSEPKKGKKIEVQTPDHICGTIEFENGAIGMLMTSFATRFGTYDRKQPITIYGTEGTMKVPDPNNFDGSVHLRRIEDEDWREMPNAFVTGYGRAVGLADMAYALRSGRPHRASGEQAFAALDLMQGFLDSARSGQAMRPATAYQRPAPMRADLPFGVFDD